MAEKTFESWALVELFGHARIAGHLSEQTIAGQGFIRVDVPATQRSPEFTRYLGPSAIYSITPVTEELAQQLAEQIYTPEPVTYLPRVRQLETGEEDAEF